MAEFNRTLELGQGLNFKQDEHQAFGYITKMTIGEESFKADVSVVDPFGALGKKESKDLGFEANNAGRLSKKVVSVLSAATWDYTPTGPIKLEGIVSLFNMNKLAAVAIMQNKGVGIQIEFVVYDYDIAASKFYPAFFSAYGHGPISGKGAAATQSNEASDANAKPLFAVLGKEGTTFGITVDQAPSTETGSLAAFKFTLNLASPRANQPQQVVIQTSTSHKLVLPWGLPQFAG